MCFSILGACIVAAQLTNADIGYSNGMPETAVSLDNTVHQIGHHYDDEQINFFVEGYLVLNTNTKIDINYDNGIDTNKYDVDPSLRIGITQLFEIRDNHFISVGAAGTIGGDQTHTPCLDADNVRFRCDTATLWSLNKTPNNSANYSGNITYTLRF